jgi:hypothetical protein
MDFFGLGNSFLQSEPIAMWEHLHMPPIIIKGDRFLLSAWRVGRMLTANPRLGA